MTIETIRIELLRSEGALIRILGTIERRGFAVQGVTMPPVLPGANSRLTQVTVSVQARHAGRCAENLTRQLRKLWDVQQVTMMLEETKWAESCASVPKGEGVTVSCAG